MAPSVKCCYDRLGYLSSIPTQVTKPGMHRVAIPGVLGAHWPASALPLYLVLASLRSLLPFLFLQIYTSRCVQFPSLVPLHHHPPDTWGGAGGGSDPNVNLTQCMEEKPNPHMGVTCSHPAHVETFNMIWSQALASKQPGVGVGVRVLTPAPSL